MRAAQEQLAAVLVQALAILLRGERWAVRSSGLLLLTMTLVQVTLGIATLLFQVPLALGLLHQAGAVVVLGLAVWHVYATSHAAVR